MRRDLLATYLLGRAVADDPYLEVFRHFSLDLFDGRRLEATDAVNEVHAASWPDAF